MLGHNVPAGYVEAIKSAEQQSTLDKRVGGYSLFSFYRNNHNEDVNDDNDTYCLIMIHCTHYVESDSLRTLI